MRNMLHVVNVMRPTENLTDGGQKQNAECVLKNWPCSIEPLSGREAERVHATFPEASLKVEGYGNPQKPFRRTDWLELKATDGALRKLHIADIQDEMQNGIELTLFCGENPL